MNTLYSGIFELKIINLPDWHFRSVLFLESLFDSKQVPANYKRRNIQKVVDFISKPCNIVGHDFHCSLC